VGREGDQNQEVKLGDKTAGARLRNKMTRIPAQGKKVAVIGSGLAGLTTAYLLRQRGVTVYLIEKVS
jgi:NADPH-dependent glutamate synthase beta subunit-like oxidoreductase